MSRLYNIAHASPSPIALIGFCLFWSVLDLAVSCEAVVATTVSNYSRAGVEQQEQDEIAVAQVCMLQGVPSSLKLRPRDAPSKLSVLKPPPSPNDYLQAATPLAWTHIPKCGTSFVNSLVRLPGVCPGVHVGDTVFGPPPYKEDTSELKDCEGVLLPTGGKGHFNVGSTYEHLYHNHGVIMLRQPEQRLISMYNHEVRTGGGIIDKYHMTLIDYANATAGCAVRMMTKDGAGWEGCEGTNSQLEFIDALEVSASDVIMAQERLRGYAFVGITEYWDESICLLHAMFGGECHPSEFLDTRNGSTSATGYDTSDLLGFVDQYDGALYEEALSIYTQNLRRYGVTANSCQPCFESGNVTAW